MNRVRAIETASVVLGGLLRDPQKIADYCRSGTALRPLAGVSLMTIAAGSAAFGAVVGSFRGGWQILFAALKIPVAMLAGLALCVPAFVALAAVFGRPWPLRTVVALALAAAARASLLLLAVAPVLWLAFDMGLNYHAAALASAIAYAVAGLAAFSVLTRGLGPRRGKLLTIASFSAVFLAALGQTSWALRPYLVRPRTEIQPLVRESEGNFVEALAIGSRSAVGIFPKSYDGARTGRGAYGGSH